MTMYKDAYTTKELIAHLNLSQAKGVLAKAKREGWQSRPRKGRGGGNEWLVESMPKATRRAIAAGLLRMQDPDSGRVPAVPDAAGTGRRAGIASRLGNLSGLSKRQREVATARLAFVREVHRLMGVVGKEAAIQSLVSAAADGSLALHLQQLVSVANDKTGNGKAKRGISRRRLYAWCSDYERGGEEALAPKHRQPDYTVPDWAPLFLSFFQQPQKPSMVQAHKDLLAAYESGKLTGKAPSLDAVRRWAKKVALPELSRGRKTGNALLSMAPCKRRSTTHMLPTDCYTADGTTFDAEVRNPLNGRPFKPEVTLVLDVATRRCVGISLSMSENMQSVLDALRMACMFGGIPAMFYADNGPGYDNLQLSTEGTGILTRLGIERAASLPGRPQGKGLMERAVGTICEPVAKRLPSCTHSDMDKDAAKKVYKITREALKRKVQTAFLPSWEDFKELMLERVVEYNATPHRALPKITDETGRRRHMSPDECWEHHVQNGFEPVRVPEDMKDELEDTCVRRDDYSSMRAEVMSRLERMDAKLDRLIERDGARNAR
ncbi:DNA-binding protein [Oleidesulfovibrio alaskensis]|uniref:DNA-binding protein n=1 Tax=Oleidesulfovibrio alaskensis TaxID=58180 RepID=UPI0009DE1AB5|nr:DNA-binding protein [Oleidesulfovibrio alaskensis]